MNRLAAVALTLLFAATAWAGGVQLTLMDSFPNYPQVENFACVADSGTQITCTWTTPKRATSQIQYQVAPIGWNTSAADFTADKTSHSVTVGGLAAGLTLYVRPKTADVYGYETVGAYILVSTPAGGSIPVLSGFATTSIGTTSATFAWTTDLSADSQVECGTSTGVYTITSTLDATTVTAHSHTITGLTADTPYFCRGLSDAGSGAGSSGEIMFVTASASALEPPNLGQLDIRNVEAGRVCIDADDDGVCEDFRFYVKQPMDTSGWAGPTDLGNNPTAAAVQSAVNSGSGCEIFELSGTVDIANNVEVVFDRDCFLLRGKSQTLATFLVADGASANALSECGGQPGSVAACGGTQGTAIGWTAGYNRDTTTLTLASDAATAGFNVWNAAAPYGPGMYVRLRSDFTVATCPEHFQRQGNQSRPGNDAIHRVVGVSGNQITIWPGLYYDYDDAAPNCGNYDARPMTIPVNSFEYINVEMADGDDGCVGTAGSLNGCSSQQAGLLLEKVQGWVTHSRFHGQVNRHLNAYDVVDYTIDENEFSNPSQPFTEPIFITSQVQIQEASSGWAVINNYCHDMRTFLHARISNQGVMAHNYCVNMRQNSAFLHGLYAGPVLVEVNDIEGYEIDRQWGLEAPRHVVYRNNIRDVAGLAAVERGFQIRHDGPGPTTLVGGNTSRGVVEDFVVIGNKATRFTGSANTPYQVFDDHNTPGAHAEYNWVTTQLGPNTGWGGCSTCTTSNLSGITGTQPSGWDAVSAPPSLFCFEDNANPMHCEDREWPPYWCQEGADFRDVSSSVGAFSPTQGDLPAKIRANSGTCTLCDSVGGSGC